MVIYKPFEYRGKYGGLNLINRTKERNTYIFVELFNA